MQSLVSIANLRSRGFSRFSPGRSAPLFPPVTPLVLRRSFVRSSVRQRATLTTATFLLPSVYYANFLAYERATTAPSSVEKVYPYLSCLYFHLFVSIVFCADCEDLQEHSKAIQTDG